MSDVVKKVPVLEGELLEADTDVRGDASSSDARAQNAWAQNAWAEDAPFVHPQVKVIRLGGSMGWLLPALLVLLPVILFAGMLVFLAIAAALVVLRVVFSLFFRRR